MDVVWDTYVPEKSKNATWEKRGQGVRRKLAGQTKLTKILVTFLQDPDNKSELFFFLTSKVQYCAKVMQTNFDEIPSFSKKFRLKQYFDEIFPHFRDTYCFDLRDFLNDNSLRAMIHREFSSWHASTIYIYLCFYSTETSDQNGKIVLNN